MSRFAVTLPDVSRQQREDAAAKLGVTAYLEWGSPVRADAMFFRTTAAELRRHRPDRARDVIDALAASLGSAGLVEAGTGGLSREDRCRVSMVLRNARNAAGGMNSAAPGHVADILEGLRAAWDSRHRDVPGDDQHLHDVLDIAAGERARERARNLKKAQEAALAEKVRQAKKLEAARAARVTARVGLVDEEQEAS